MAEVAWEPEVPEPGEDPHWIARRDRWLEWTVVLMLSITSLLTAWTSFEATRWGGEQSERLNEAAALRTDAIRAASTGDHLATIDVVSFANYLTAYATGNERLAAFYQERFRDEFLPAFDAWLATEPLTHLDAPGTPFDLPEYQIASRIKAQELDEQAEAQAIASNEANENSEAYVQTVVVLAMILFLGGISSRVTIDFARFGMIGLAGLLLLYSLIRLATLPIM